VRYRWPGNVRELENVLERLAVHASIASRAERVDVRLLAELVPEMGALDAAAYAFTPEMQRLDAAASVPSGRAVPPAAGRGERLKERGRASERALIERALAECGGDRDAVCRQLGISKSTLWRRLRQGSFQM
jgi:propionate catabolism operon transcriptional regulator